MAPIAGSEGLDPEFYSRLSGLIIASNGKIWIGNGFRTREQQQYFYDLYLSGEGNLAAVPGTSNHEFGLAVDLAGDLAWANQHAAQFGLHFPVSGENWHIEMIGASDHIASGSGPADTFDPDLGIQEALAEQPSTTDSTDALGQALAKILGNPFSTAGIAGEMMAPPDPVENVSNADEFQIANPGSELDTAPAVTAPAAALPEQAV